MIGASTIRMVCAMAVRSLSHPDYKTIEFLEQSNRIARTINTMKSMLRGLLSSCLRKLLSEPIWRDFVPYRIAKFVHRASTPGENHGISHRLHLHRRDPIALGASRPAGHRQIL